MFGPPSATAAPAAGSSRPAPGSSTALRGSVARIDDAFPRLRTAKAEPGLFEHRRSTGRLPVSWPRTVAQEPLDVGDPGYDQLYRFGYGLRTR